jgi:hypothetical protein
MGCRLNKVEEKTKDVIKEIMTKKLKTKTFKISTKIWS